MLRTAGCTSGVSRASGTVHRHLADLVRDGILRTESRPSRRTYGPRKVRYWAAQPKAGRMRKSQPAELVLGATRELHAVASVLEDLSHRLREIARDTTIT